MPSTIARARGAITRGIGRAWSVIMAPGEATDERIAEAARAVAPIVWLLGKVQSGKTSIVKALTASTEAEIGTGFKACTRTSRVFDYPAEAPVIRFLDTRGLGEAGYDPAEDISFAEDRAQLLVVVVKALDHDQDAVLELVTKERRQHPEWPVVVAQTALHEAYRSGEGHALPYPFDIETGALSPDAQLPVDLTRSLARQRQVFGGLPGNGPIIFVPIDFTHKDDGFEPVSYGLDALLEGLRRVAPTSVAAVLEAAHGRAQDATARRAHPHVLGYAMAAAAADVVPVAGMIAVPGIQGKMLHSLARIYGVHWNRRMLVEFAAALGAGTLVRGLSTFGVRELVKLVPIYGQTAGAAAAAAASFATTYALGKAACFYLGRWRTGRVEMAEVAAAYRQALVEAFRMTKERDIAQEAEKAGT